METLLEELKRALQITWDESNAHLTDCLKRGQSKLNALTGTTIDFDKNVEARALLLDYCRYDYNNFSEHFEECFAHEILRLQLAEAIDDAKAKQEA
jgi:hypothetical protein|nr:MAG TPA: Head Tail Connector Protein [Caudoviricetes sp.]